MAAELHDGLAKLVHRLFGEQAGCSDPVRLPGGASRETWGFTVTEGPLSRRLVLRRDPPGTTGPGTAREADILQAAGRMGVPVPSVLLASSDHELLGAPFVIMEHVEGETIPRRILREPALTHARGSLAAACGRALAAIHALDPSEVPWLEPVEPLEQARQLLDALGEPHPTFELALRSLEARRPPEVPATVVHGDFRNGNLIVGPDGLRAVLDWELAHLGDPREDLGWLCAKAWRFGAELPVGGFGTYEQLLSAYAEAGGEVVHREALAWWEAAGTLRWGVICMLQAATHRSGAVESVELAAVGRRVCEQEWDLLSFFDPELPGEPPAPLVGDRRRRGWAPHDPPSAVELLHAVRHFLDAELGKSLTGRPRYLARVAANVVAMVARELGEGEHLEALHRRALADLRVDSEEELAAAIRSGRFEDTDPSLLAALRTTVAAKLAVAHPDYR